MNTKHKIKIKYSLQILVLSLVFLAYAAPALASEITKDNVIKLVNQARDADGLAPLTENKTLNQIAEDKASDMVKNNYFAHTSPAGISPWYWFEKENYDYKYAGENLAINFLSVETQHKAWLDSATHRKNILNVNYQEIGVAVAAGEINGKTSIVTVQEFGSRVGAPQELNNEKNFSGKEKTNLIENEKTELGPTVLSIKNLGNDKLDINNSVGNNSQNNSLGEYFKNILAKFNSNKTLAYNYIFELAVILTMISLGAAPMAFTKKAYDEIFSLIDYARKTRALSTISLKEYEEWLKNIGRQDMSGGVRIIKVRPG